MKIGIDLNGQGLTKGNGLPRRRCGLHKTTQSRGLNHSKRKAGETGGLADRRGVGSRWKGGGWAGKAKLSYNREAGVDRRPAAPRAEAAAGVGAAETAPPLVERISADAQRGGQHPPPFAPRGRAQGGRR